MNHMETSAAEMEGIVFDIEEFAVFDGPGIRTTVFLKGCPLRCNWCHNPEGLQKQPQRMVSGLCVNCGTCKSVCPSPEHCIGCGACVAVCPRHCITISGKKWTAESLAAELSKNADILKMNGGGITFSGGECTMQADFMLAIRRLLPDIHMAIETCGYCSGSTFRKVISAMDLVIMDIKHTDPAIHKQYTGVDNSLIRENLRILMGSNTPFLIRVPLIPGVNDSEENLTLTAQWIQNAKNLLGVELLPYNEAAGAKYHSLNMKYQPKFNTAQKPRLYTECFEKLGIAVKIM